MTRFARERVHDLWDEAAVLLAQGFAEFDPHPEIPLDVNRRVYEELEDAGLLRVYTARANGELVGYAVFTLVFSIRRMTLLQAQQDLIHVDRAYRGRTTAALLRYAEKALRADNVKLLYHSTPIKGSGLSRLLEILGYQQIAQVYEKVL